MEFSEMDKRITNLGRAIVEELSDIPHADTLSRWMAHYVAEQITIAEQAKGPKKARAEAECFKTITALWKHRGTLAFEKRPFRSFDPILRTLERLSPDKREPFYHRLPSDAPTEPGSVEDLMRFVESIDRAARVLIAEALNIAAAKATGPRTKIFLENAISEAPSVDVEIIVRLLDEAVAENDEPKHQTLKLRRKLSERLEMLRKFGDICGKLQSELEKRQNQL